MRHKRVLALLIATAVLSVAGNVVIMRIGGIYLALLAFPFEQLGAALRSLSLSGAAGNMIAVALYCLISLLPAFYLARRALKRRARVEDALLAVLSAVLFVVLYRMINPPAISVTPGFSELIIVGKAQLGGVVYSTALGYIVLRALRLFSRSGEGSLLKYLYVLLAVICAIQVFTIFGSGPGWLLGAFRTFAGDNTDGAPLGASYVFLALQHLMKLLPYALNIAVVWLGLDLITELRLEPYSDGTVAAARRLGRVCVASLIVIMLSQMSLNVAQLLFAELVRYTSYTLSIPLFSIVLTLAALLLAKYFGRGKEMKDEGDMFI